MHLSPEIFTSIGLVAFFDWTGTLDRAVVLSNRLHAAPFPRLSVLSASTCIGSHFDAQVVLLWFFPACGALVAVSRWIARKATTTAAQHPLTMAPVMPVDSPAVCVRVCALYSEYRACLQLLACVCDHFAATLLSLVLLVWCVPAVTGLR